VQMSFSFQSPFLGKPPDCDSHFSLSFRNALSFDKYKFCHPGRSWSVGEMHSQSKILLKHQIKTMFQSIPRVFDCLLKIVEFLSFTLTLNQFDKVISLPNAVTVLPVLRFL
jgi:hypothetical protein